MCVASVCVDCCVLFVVCCVLIVVRCVLLFARCALPVPCGSLFNVVCCL